MKKQTLAVAMALAIGAGTPDIGLSRAAGAVSAQDKQIADLLKRLEERFDVRFSYESGLKNLKVRNGFETDPPQKDGIGRFVEEAAMDRVTVVRMDGDAYVIRKTASPLLPKGENRTAKSVRQQSITGTVVDDATGEPIAGATVRTKTGNLSTQTDADGQFTFEGIGITTTVTISMLGYRTEETVVANKQTIRLTRGEQALDEVVVTALGIKREQKALGYAVQEIKGGALQQVKGVDVGTTLTGRVAGLRVFNSTEFNATPSIRLRGMSPILVVDGVAYENMTLRDIPVDEIENISVLKGATATALYGSMGAGGAIMVSTKKGLPEQGTQIAVNTNNMFFAGYLALPEVQSSYSAGEGGKYHNGSTNIKDGKLDIDNVWGDKLDIGRMYRQWNPITKELDANPTELTSKGKNNFQNFLEPGFISNNSVSFTNQGENGSIRTSVSHVHNKGQYPNTRLNMTNISLAGETKISEKINLESRFGYNRRHTPNNFGAGYGAQGYIYNILVWTGPEYDLMQYKDYWKAKDEEQNWHYAAWYDNPYLAAHEKTSAELINKLNAAVTLNYAMTDWGKLMFRTGYDHYGNTLEQRNPKGINGTRGGFSGYHALGKYWSSKRDGFSTTNDLIFTANKAFGDFAMDGLAGGAAFYRRDNQLTASTVNGIAIPGFYSLRNSIGPVSATESKRKEMVNSVYGRLSIAWRNAVFVEATGRNDWSSTLPRENRSYFYPSVSGSVVLSDLVPAIKPAGLNLLKLRGSWAVTKAVPDPYEINQSFTVRTGVWDGMSTGTYPEVIKDYAISPTQRDSWEVGVEFSALGQRVFGDYTYYARKLHNIKRDATISGATGFTARLINLKEERMTRGHEIALGGIPVKKKDFQWTVNGTLSQNLEYYHKLDEEYSADALHVQVGMRTDHYTFRDFERAPDGQIVHGANGRPVKAVYAPRLYGYTAPKFFWGLANEFRYRDFGLSFSIDGRIKGLSYSEMNDRLWQTGAHPDSDTPERYEEVVNGNVTYIGPGVKVVSGSVTYDKYGQVESDDRVFAPNDQAVSYETYWNNHRSGEWNIWDETFIKLREVSLSYALPTDVAKRLSAKKASIGVTGQNLLLWTKEYRFSDPDTGSEDLNSPSMRYIGFNINVSF